TLEPAAAVERAQRHRQHRIELVQVPAQALLAAAPLGDEVVAVIEEQLQLAQRGLLRPWPVEPRLTQRRPRDREGVDSVRLAADTAAAARRSGQPWRHAHQPLASLEQQPLQAAAEIR